MSLVIALLCTAAVQAGDLEDGFDAYYRKDYATALTKWRSAAQQGDAYAQNLLGAMYMKGQGVEHDYKEAVRWYKLAAEQGRVEAQYDLGVSYAEGKGVARDYKEAMHWYKLSAAQGFAAAQYNLGTIYHNGDGVAQDYKEAVRLFQLAAAQGFAAAQNSLGVMYARGQGVAQDDGEAVRWYQSAATQGNAPAQFNLAFIAATKGSASAQFNVGFMYERGQGVAKDYKEAVRWYKLAAAQGNVNAKIWLEIAESKAAATPTTTATAANSNQTETGIRPSDVEAERKKRQEIEELLAQERKAKAAELEAATRKQQELEARLRESAERERLANEARLQASPTAPIAQVQQPQIAVRKERRLALVIGNSNYKGGPLDNPVNDATDIASQLKNFGFQTTLLRDATLAQMRDATRKFADQLPSTDVALVYFAGHGIEMKGRNYMIPTNADVKFEYELSEQAYDAGIWLEMLETIKSSNADRVNIVILDACRNNGLIAARSVSRGLGKMDAPSGTFLAYSTSPGKIASDGARGERNSPFTKHLIKAMQQPNKPIEEVFKEVRRNVGRETNGAQVPWESTSLTGFFTFKQSQ